MQELGVGNRGVGRGKVPSHTGHSHLGSCTILLLEPNDKHNVLQYDDSAVRDAAQLEPGWRPVDSGRCRSYLSRALTTSPRSDNHLLGCGAPCWCWLAVCILRIKDILIRVETASHGAMKANGRLGAAGGVRDPITNHSGVPTTVAAPHPETGSNPAWWN